MWSWDPGAQPVLHTVWGILPSLAREALDEEILGHGVWVSEPAEVLTLSEDTRELS